jgi:cobalt-zinc-cadmium efflux system protein
MAAHMGQHAHTHDHQGHVHSLAALRTAFLLNLAFTVVEAVGGWWSGSIAVLSDALHDAGDCLVLGAAWYLQHVARRGRDALYSYGYGRYSMLGGWLTSVVLIIGALIMIIVSVPRLLHPELPKADGMIAIAVFGLVMNGLAAWTLHRGSSLNERGAYLHLLEDVLGWAAVLAGGILMHFTSWAVVDPLLSIAISIFILYNALGTIRKGTGILMQQTPPALDLEEIGTHLLAIPEVTGLHDQHTWTLDGHLIIHTVHLVVGRVDLPRALAIKSEARAALKAFGIDHATIELEWTDEPCDLRMH